MAKTQKFEVCLTANPPNGGYAVGAGQFKAGRVVEIAAVHATGYRFRGWSDGNRDNPRKLKVPAVDLGLRAEFELVPPPQPPPRPPQPPSGWQQAWAYAKEWARTAAIIAIAAVLLVVGWRSLRAPTDLTERRPGTPVGSPEAPKEAKGGKVEEGKEVAKVTSSPAPVAAAPAPSVTVNPTVTVVVQPVPPVVVPAPVVTVTAPVTITAVVQVPPMPTATPALTPVPTPTPPAITPAQMPASFTPRRSVNVNNIGGRAVVIVP